MEASLAYSAKKPILSDAEFDELKRKLRKQNSKVVQQARAPVPWPPCSAPAGAGAHPKCPGRWTA